MKLKKRERNKAELRTDPRQVKILRAGAFVVSLFPRDVKLKGTRRANENLETANALPRLICPTFGHLTYSAHITIIFSNTPKTNATTSPKFRLKPTDELYRSVISYVTLCAKFRLLPCYRASRLIPMRVILL